MKSRTYPGQNKTMKYMRKINFSLKKSKSYYLHVVEK